MPPLLAHGPASARRSATHGARRLLAPARGASPSSMAFARAKPSPASYERATCCWKRCVSSASPPNTRTVRMFVKVEEATSASRCCAAALLASRLRVCRRYRKAVQTEATMTPARMGPSRQLREGRSAAASSEGANREQGDDRSNCAQQLCMTVCLGHGTTLQFCMPRHKLPACGPPGQPPTPPLAHLSTKSTPTVPAASSTARSPRSRAVLANTKARMESRSRDSSWVRREEEWRSKNSTRCASRARNASARRLACTFSPAAQALRM